MRLEYFKYRMKHDRCSWDITENVTMFVEKKSVELWDIRTNETQVFKTIDDLLDVEVEGKKVRDYIDQMDDLPPLIFYEAM